MNFAAGGDYVMVNTPAMLRAMAARVRELGVRPELEVFDTGHLVLVHELIRDGPDRRPRAGAALHGHPLRRARRSRDAARDGRAPAAGLGLLGVLDRAHAAAVRGDGGARGRQRARRARGQPLPVARRARVERRARRRAPCRSCEAMNVRILGPADVRERLALTKHV